jgi:hypothetical protein
MCRSHGGAHLDEPNFPVVKPIHQLQPFVIDLWLLLLLPVRSLARASTIVATFSIHVEDRGVVKVIVHHEAGEKSGQKVEVGRKPTGSFFRLEHRSRFL